MNQIKLYDETLLQNPSQKDSADDINHFLKILDIPKLSTDQIILFDIELTEKDLYDSMKTMENDICLKRNFRDNIKVIFISSIKQVRERKELNISQRQL